jgi:hypothetical protein
VSIGGHGVNTWTGFKAVTTVEEPFFVRWRVYAS